MRSRSRSTVLADRFAEQFDGIGVEAGEMQVEAADAAVLDAEGGVGPVVDQGEIV